MYAYRCVHVSVRAKYLHIGQTQNLSQHAISDPLGLFLAPHAAVRVALIHLPLRLCPRRGDG